MGHGMYVSRSQTSRLPANEESVRGTKQTLGNICKGVMPSPSRIIHSGSNENNTSGIVLSKIEIKLKPSLSSSCCLIL